MQRSAIIVGVGPGLGAALAWRFARGGHRVALLARNAGRLASLAREIGGGARGYGVDVADLAALADTIRSAADDLGPPAALVFNVSRWLPADAADLAPEVLDRELRVSATAALAASQAALPSMRGAGGGTLIWTGGGLALSPEQGGQSPTFAAGKAAMRALALASAASFRKTGAPLTTITIAGTIARGTAFDPDRIAEVFWHVLQTPETDRPAEIVYRGTD